MPISAAEIGEGLANAGSVLAQSGNTVDESIALLTAANSSLQDISTAASSIRVASMRIRGTSAKDLQEAGEDIDGLIEDGSKLRKIIMDLTKTSEKPIGIDILSNTGDYKSTYEILLQIQEVYDDLTDQKRANCLPECTEMYILECI